ncbi:family 43 glycosylhydrolase [Niabella drilacis]|uniref:F5/8 type C domain-containing protein n=1 Tax=Niabella drilacis (strain DSM 25811 / CCM 8410 / CCUG 62505 / LMG 26954 / E90) TaxID=1285928 RepID=A0A1G6R7U7_NIADE|nr:family 43 glycosylhydrolase [Niabella drilacis]SDD00165.1 F5/8 type C domain-containing protein [Niabella drilacis]
MNKIKVILIGCCLLSAAAWGQAPATWCNPLNLNYRFSYDGLGYREAADPVIHLYRNTYFLYASKSGGYWHSSDLLNWVFLPSKTLPTEDYAPTVATIHDTVFFIASKGARNIYYSTDPKTDNWKVYREKFPLGVTDPALFNDDDGKVYFYYGCSNVDPIMGVELDTQRRFDTIGTPLVLIQHNIREHGWEEHGETHSNGKKGWNEGAWMNKYNGKYYLQYASPGTEFKVYGDGVYVSDKPLGPFTYMPNSPFSYKPGGFINGAGHGSTFKDRYGNYWHVATMTISVRHMFERRIGLFPAFFDKDGQLHCNTAFGDYPSVMPHRKMDFGKESLFTGWMLLSYNKPVQASSTLPGHAPEQAVNEEIRNWWSAQTGNAGEWLQVDLQQQCTVNALQVNFADQDALLKAGMAYGPYQFVIEGSADGKSWKPLIDRTDSKLDRANDYIVLPRPVKTRFLRITNRSVPGGKFSLSGFRVFGKGAGNRPAAVNSVEVSRDAADSRRGHLVWKQAATATGYVVYFGTAPHQLFHSAMVYDKSNLELPGLNKDVPYYFRVDAFNENGITKGKETKAY